MIVFVTFSVLLSDLSDVAAVVAAVVITISPVGSVIMIQYGNNNQVIMTTPKWPNVLVNY